MNTISKWLTSLALLPLRACDRHPGERKLGEFNSYSGWKRHAALILRLSLRTYLRFAPWTTFKKIAFDKFRHYVGWQPYSAVTRTRHGFRMLTETTDLLSAVVYLTGQWEPHLTAYVQERLRPGDIFVDVGANIGYYSLLSSELVDSSGRVYAIEASPSTFSALLENIERNGCKNILPVNAAAAEMAGELAIWRAEAANRGHSTTVKELAKAEGMEHEATVRAETIENLVGPDVLRQARLIKIDVEGAERAVMTPLLSSVASLSKDTEWLIEITPDFTKDGQHDANWLFDTFVASGYSAYVFPSSDDFSGFFARPQKSALKRIVKLPERQADILFRWEAQANPALA